MRFSDRLLGRGHLGHGEKGWQGSPRGGEAQQIPRDIYRGFGLKTRIIAPAMGMCLFLTMELEEGRLARGWTCEPQCLCERKRVAQSLQKAEVPAEQNGTHPPF